MPNTQGFSLIEVIASLVLMAILMTTALMAYGCHAAQIRKAHERLAAIEACDALIAHSMRRPSEYEGRTSGVLAGPQQRYRWRRVVLNSHAADLFDAQVIRWEVYQGTRDGPSEPITKLDVLVPKPEPPIEADHED